MFARVQGEVVGAWQELGSYSPWIALIAADSSVVMGPQRVGEDGAFVYVAPAECGRPVRLTNAAPGNTEPTWSPNGQSIAFITFRTGNEQIWSMSASGEGQRALTTVERGQIHGCDWSASGILFAVLPEMPPPGIAKETMLSRGIYSIPPSGGAPSPIVVDAFQNEQPAWSPDGTHLVFVSDRSGDPDLWVAAIGDTARVHLTDDPGIDRFPSWSPDGSRIAFMSNRAETLDIWIVPASGGDPECYCEHPEGRCLSSAWSPDGTEIAFTLLGTSGQPPKSDIWILKVQ